LSFNDLVIEDSVLILPMRKQKLRDVESLDLDTKGPKR
jgi:hypothetical protein